MNIFFLSEDPHEAASFLCDKHIGKLQLETAQLISTALSYSSLANHAVVLEPGWDSVAELAYKPTHMNHPCAVWARSSNANLDWLLEYVHGMNREWLRRKRLRGLPEDQIVSHASYKVSVAVAEFLLRSCNQVDKYTRRVECGGNKLQYDPDLLTEVPLCMPEELWPTSGRFVQSIDEAVPYYRAYYKLHKASIATWPETRVPDWLQSYTVI